MESGMSQSREPGAHSREPGCESREPTVSVYVDASACQFPGARPLRRQQSTLSDAEREAIERAMNTLNGIEDLSPTATANDEMAIATLRRLLERTK
jgi:methylphosphotriester-DNA--protein-cysteine methyltransferase